MNENFTSNLAGLTVAQLNEIRKDLLLEVRDLRKRQSDCLDKVYQEVAKDQEDIAENFFSTNNESNGKYFSQRLDTCMRAVVSLARHFHMNWNKIYAVD